MLDGHRDVMRARKLHEGERKKSGSRGPTTKSDAISIRKPELCEDIPIWYKYEAYLPSGRVENAAGRRSS